MKVYINVTGGPLPYGVRGQLDMADLPEDLAQRVETSLQHEQMQELISRSRSEPMPDEQVYEVMVIDGPGQNEPVRYVFAESEAAPELLDLVDELRLAVTDQLMKQAYEPPAAPPAAALPAEPPAKRRRSRKDKTT